MSKARLPVRRSVQSRALTQREREIYLLLLEGRANKEIANELSVSVRTVRFHVANILSKFRVASRLGLFTLLLRRAGSKIAAV